MSLFLGRNSDIWWQTGVKMDQRNKAALILKKKKIIVPITFVNTQ